MFRNSPVGVVFLAACAVVVIVLVWQIITGERFQYSGPDWLGWALLVIMVGGSLYALFQSKIRKQDQQWPNPGAGRRSLWDRIRGKNKTDV